MRELPARDPFVPVVRCAADLLAVVPHTLGYWPEDSLVLFAAGGAAAGACVRVDLPADPADARFAETFVAELAELVRHDALSDRVFVIAYTAAPAPDAGAAAPARTRPALAGVLALVDEAADRAGRSVAARWVVAGRRWWPAGDPADVRDVCEIHDSAVNAALVATGSSYATIPWQAMDHEYGDLPPGTVRGVAAHAARWALAAQGSWHRLDRLAPTLAVWREVLAGVETAGDRWIAAVLGHDDDLLGFLAAGLGDPVLADLLLASCATDDDEGVLAAAAVWAGLCADVLADVPDDLVGPAADPTPGHVPPVPRAASGGRRGGPSGPGARRTREPDAEQFVRLCRVLAGECAEAPAWERLDALYRVLLALSWLLAPEGRPQTDATGGPEAAQHGAVLAGVLVELAQLNRFRARGSYTAHFAGRAAALVPDHPAAQRVRRQADARPVPLWARDRTTAWHA